MDRRFAIKSFLAATAALSLPLVSVKTALAATTHTVLIKGFQFVPSELTVKVGDIIEFKNRDGQDHTATAKDRSWDTRGLSTGAKARIEVTADMATDYFCRFHPKMNGFLKIDG